MRPFVAFANQILIDIVIENVKDMYITIFIYFLEIKI
jgi:hypothetical protein